MNWEQWLRQACDMMFGTPQRVVRTAIVLFVIVFALSPSFRSHVIYVAANLLAVAIVFWIARTCLFGRGRRGHRGGH